MARFGPAEQAHVDALELGTGRRYNPSAPAIAVGSGAVWAVGSSSVHRIVPSSNAIVATIPITGGTGPGPAPIAVAAGDGAVWVANRVSQSTPLTYRLDKPGTVSRIDPRTNAVVATIAVGRYPGALAVGAGAVWVANRNSETLSEDRSALEHGRGDDLARCAS